MSLGQKIKGLRIERNWSTAHLAELSNCTLSTINGIENDKRSPQIDTLFRIASAMDLPLIELLPIEAHMGPTPLSDAEKQLLALFSKMTVKQRSSLLEFLEAQKEPSR
jgi:transcriptional regulator with XRE-family HTH domain